jgi:hypothetical protein
MNDPKLTAAILTLAAMSKMTVAPEDAMKMVKRTFRQCLRSVQDTGSSDETFSTSMSSKK